MKFTLQHSTFAALTAAALAMAPAAGAAIIFDETFEGYALGNANGQGGWVDFGGALTTDIVDTNASTGTQSIRFSSPVPGGGYGSDSTLDLAAPITTGQLLLTFDIFHSAGFNGNAFVFFSRGATNAPDVRFEQGLFLVGDGTAGTFRDDGSATTGLLVDQWVPVTINIDLDANTSVATYGGTTIYSGPWVVDVNAPVLPSQYQGIDIWASDGTSGGSFYIDNLRLETIPEPGATALLGLAVLGLLIRRR